MLNLAETETDIQRLEKKVDELIEFTNELKSLVRSAANAGGMQGAMLKSMLPGLAQFGE